MLRQKRHLLLQSPDTRCSQKKKEIWQSQIKTAEKGEKEKPFCQYNGCSSQAAGHLEEGYWFQLVATMIC